MQTNTAFKYSEQEVTNYHNVNFCKQFRKGDTVHIKNNSLKIGKILDIDTTTSCPLGFKGWIKVEWQNNNRTIDWVLSGHLVLILEKKQKKMEREIKTPHIKAKFYRVF